MGDICVHMARDESVFADRAEDHVGAGFTGG